MALEIPQPGDGVTDVAAVDVALRHLVRIEACAGHRQRSPGTRRALVAQFRPSFSLILVGALVGHDEERLLLVLAQTLGAVRLQEFEAHHRTPAPVPRLRSGATTPPG